MRVESAGCSLVSVCSLARGVQCCDYIVYHVSMISFVFKRRAITSCGLDGVFVMMSVLDASLVNRMHSNHHDAV